MLGKKGNKKKQARNAAFSIVTGKRSLKVKGILLFWGARVGGGAMT